MAQSRTEWYERLLETFETAVAKEARDNKASNEEIRDEIAIAMNHFEDAIMKAPEIIRPEVWSFLCASWVATLTHVKKRTPCPESLFKRSPINDL